MKKESSKVIVSNPCNEDWSKMSSSENGRHCKTCNKTVIDFSHWEISDIKSYLKKTGNHICGHFQSLQVMIERPIHHQFLVDVYFQTEKKIKSTYLKSLILSLIMACMFLVGCNVPSEKSTKGFDSSENNKINGDSIKVDSGRTTGKISLSKHQDFDETSNDENIQ
jgi:hypothetical protein